MQLIITEKNDVAKKISGILALGAIKEESHLRIPYYLFTDASGLASACIGLKGHVVQVDFPPEYSEWRKVEPKSLIDAPLVKTETAKSVVRAVKRLAVDATTLIIATDFDREGELIGLEALNLAVEENARLSRTVRRARFSALTPSEITRAFKNLDQLSEPLARAGEARQDIDLIWGATLTRFVSLATSRLGSQFLSVGRVQTPTLVLIAEREKERRAFVSEPFWVVKVELDSGGQRFSAVHKEERFTDEAKATAVFEKIATPGQVTAVKQTSRKVPRPAPFNTTSFTSAATSLGFGAAQAMRIAEDLYMAGHISYPRTDNTVYPSSLDLREALEILAQGEFKREAGQLLAQPGIASQPGRQADHRPPAHLSHGSPQRGRAQRSGLAPLRIGGPALHGHLGRRGGHGVQPGGSWLTQRRALLRPGQPGGARRLARVLSLQPPERPRSCPCSRRTTWWSWWTSNWRPRRPSPRPAMARGPLIELMEKHNLGTKATRHAIIQNLYDRGYVHGNPVEPTEMGIKMAEALQEFAPRIASPEMTAELEKDMDSHLRARSHQGRGGEDLPRPVAPGLQLAGAEQGADGGQDLRGHHRRPHPGPLPQVRQRTGCASSGRRPPRSASWAARATPTATRPIRCRSGATSSAPTRSAHSAAAPRSRSWEAGGRGSSVSIPTAPPRTSTGQKEAARAAALKGGTTTGRRTAKTPAADASGKAGAAPVRKTASKTTKSAPARKAAAKKPAAKKPAAKKPTATKPTATKSAVRKPAARKPAAGKATEGAGAAATEATTSMAPPDGEV